MMLLVKGGDMKYRIDLPGFTDQDLQYDYGFLRSSLLRDGIAVESVAPKKKEFQLLDDQGKEQTVELKSGFGDTLPKVIMNGETYLLAPKLTPVQLTVAALPHLPLFLGGALGGALCALGFSASLHFFRSGVSSMLAYFLVFVSAAGTWLTYLVVSVLFTSLFGGG